MKIYTKFGDNGVTSLRNTKDITKDHMIFNVIGNLDELSANIGLLKTYCYNDKELVAKLLDIQNTLLNIGSDIAYSPFVPKLNYSPSDTNYNEKVMNLESWIDKCEEKNTPLKNFILVGVNLSDAQSQICRAVCRRTERIMVEYYIFIGECTTSSLIPLEKRIEEILVYMNRLSDYFFVLARNLSNCQEEIHK